MEKLITVRTVEVGGKTIRYQLERKPVKNLNLRIRSDGTVYVSATPNVCEAQVDQFVIRKSEYITTNIARFRELERYTPKPKQYVSGETFFFLGHDLRLIVMEHNSNQVSSDGVYLRLSVQDTENTALKQKIVTKYFDQRRRKIFQNTLNEIYPVFAKYGVAVPQLRIREMDTRWGSCLAKKGIITLNKRLIEAPMNCIEYVITHELCHFIHPNHSKQFYEFLSMLMPDWRERKKTLDQCAIYWL